MGYQIKKKKHIVKTLDLLGADGKVEKTLTVDIVVDDFRNRYPAVMAEVKKAQAMLDASGEDDVEAIVGAQVAVTAVFDLIFGRPQTRDFLEYYENRYSEAFLDVIPFVTDEIMPEVQKAVEQENKRIQDVMK